MTAFPSIAKLPCMACSSSTYRQATESAPSCLLPTFRSQPAGGMCTSLLSTP